VLIMAREVFIPYKPQDKTLVVVDQANAIIDQYQADNLRLTLRQLFYQFVARALLPNTFQNYKRLGSIINNARDGGLIDWDALEDRGREVVTHSAWDSPADIVKSAANSYREDLWATQPYRPEVWIEKAALLGVIEGVCVELRVPYFANIGNASQTLLYEAGTRFGGFLDQGLIPVVFHLGDHDPNGIDMTRDITARLERYARAPIDVRRIALTLDQVRAYNPPPNFAKESDTRFASYVRTFGTQECWELDALPPNVIVDLVREAVTALIDETEWRAAADRENKSRDLLRAAVENWTKVEKVLRLYAP
jgi:hypothetical protein